MISLEELKELQKLSNYNLGQAEKDFYQNVVLFCLYKELGKELVFKGGTALTKCYGLDRFSEDLDFTLTKEQDIQSVLEKWLKKTKNTFEIETKKAPHNSTSIRLLIQGPLYNGTRTSMCSVRIDISRREQVLLPTNIIIIRTNTPLLPTFDVIAMNKEEIAAEKIRAMVTRNQARDAYDYYLLGIRPDKNLVNKKLSYYNKTYDKNEVVRAIDEKKKIWEPELKNLLLHVPSFNEAQEKILSILP